MQARFTNPKNIARFTRPVAMGLLLVFLFQLFGTVVLYRLQRKQHRQIQWHAIRTQTRLHTSLVLHLSPEDMEWMEGEKEFRYKGDLYDVVTIDKTNSSHWNVECVADTKEDILVSNFVHREQKHNNEDGVMQLLSALTLDKNIETGNTHLPPPIRCITEFRFNLLYHFTQLYLSEPTMPPETVGC